MELWSYPIYFAVLCVLTELRNCAPVDQGQLLDMLSNLKVDLQKNNYNDLPALPYGGNSVQSNAVEKLIDAGNLDDDPADKGKRYPPLPWNKRGRPLPVLPWNKRGRPLPALPWNKRGRPLPALPWDKRGRPLPVLPWDKRGRPLPPLPWNKRLQLDDVDKEGYIEELLKMLEEWESQNTEKRPGNRRLPALPWNKRVPPLPWYKRVPPLPSNKRSVGTVSGTDKRLPPLPPNKRKTDDAAEANDLETLVSTLYQSLQDLEDHEKSSPNTKRADYASLKHFLQMTHSLHDDDS